MSSAANEFVRMNKPREIEEFLDTYLIRPMGFVLVQVLRHTRITPNMVSVASVFAGIGAGICYAERDWAGVLGGLGFLLLSSALDSADGQLARATNQKTQFGRLLDGVCDNLAFIAIYIGIIVAYAQSGGQWVFLVFLFAAAAGFSHSAQSALTDYARSLFLYYCFGGKEPADEQPEVLRQKLKELKAGGGDWLTRTMLFLHLDYAKKQRRLMRSSDELQMKHAAAVKARPELAEPFGRRYHERNKGLIRQWALLASNSHKIAIVLSSMLPLIFADGFLHDAGMVLFFGYDLFILNLAMAYLIPRQRQVDAEMNAYLDELTAH